MIPKFLYPFLAYRSLLMPFLVVSAIAVPAWLIFRLYRLRTHGRLTFHREILLLAFVVYLCGLAAVTLIPNQSPRLRAEAPVGINLDPNLASLTCLGPTLTAGSTARAFCVRNARGNVALFFPLGILIPLLWANIRFRRGIVIAIAVSLGIELVQYLSRTWSYRAADINDVVLNVFGATLGLLLVMLLRLRRGARPAIARA
jgi:glycopeptide antibiotics resistance protein